MPTRLLSHDEILQVRAAVISARLSESRASLLAGLPVEFVASLPHAVAPGEQVLLDLDTMNTVVALVDGSVPLVVWLSNAVALTGLRVEAEILEALRNRCRAVEAMGQALKPEDHGSSVHSHSLTPHNLPPRRIFVGRDRELAHIDEVLHRGSHIAQASLWGLAGVGKTALALEYAHRALVRNQYPGGIWWVMAEGRPPDTMRRLEAILRTQALKSDRVENILLGVPDKASTVQRNLTLRLALEIVSEPSLLVLDNISERGFLEILPGRKVRILMTTRDRTLAFGKDAWIDVLSQDDARAFAMQIAGPTEREMEILDRVVVHMLGGLAVAVEVAARAVKLWAGGWSPYEKLLLKQPGKVLDRERDRSEHYPPGIVAALDASAARCSNQARKLLEGLAAFAPDAVPLAWAFEAAKLDPDDVDSQEALGALDGLGLVKLERSAGVASLHRLVRARVRERTDPETWRETRLRAVKQVASWVKRKTTDEQEMCAIEVHRAHIDEALAAVEADAIMWSWIANGLAAHLVDREEYGEAVSMLEHAVARVENAYGHEHPELARCLSNLECVLKSQENARLVREQEEAKRRAEKEANRRAEEEAKRADRLAQEAKQRWRNATPVCLVRYWYSMHGLEIDLTPIRQALEAAYPDPSIRSLVLFEWLGSSNGSWNSAPNYESVPELLLLEYPTAVLVASLTSHQLTSAHVQGATRYFAAWRFFQKKRNELDAVPNELKQIFVTHSLASNYDEGKLYKVNRAFGYAPAQKAAPPAAAPDDAHSLAPLGRTPRT